MKADKHSSKKTVGIIGHFGGKKVFLDGQTIKTKILYEELRNTMLMCHKVTHKKLIDNSPLFRKNFKVEFHGSHTNCVASFA